MTYLLQAGAGRLAFSVSWQVRTLSELQMARKSEEVYGKLSHFTHALSSIIDQIPVQYPCYQRQTHTYQHIHL